MRRAQVTKSHFLFLSIFTCGVLLTFYIYSSPYLLAFFAHVIYPNPVAPSTSKMLLLREVRINFFDNSAYPSNISLSGPADIVLYNHTSKQLALIPITPKQPLAPILIEPYRYLMWSARETVDMQPYKIHISIGAQP